MAYLLAQARALKRARGAPALVAAVALFASLLSCEGAPARSKPWRHPTPATSGDGGVDPAASGERGRADRPDSELRVHLPADPVHLFPLDRPTRWANAITIDAVYETLLSYRGTEQRPLLATGVRPLSGGRAFRFELAKGVRFHDGKAMTSSDVVASLRRATRRGSGYASGLRDVASVAPSGPLGVVVTVRRGGDQVVRAIASVPIVRASSAYRKAPAGESLFDRVATASPASVARAPSTTTATAAAAAPTLAPAGTGPFALASAEHGEVVLTRNDAYWGRLPKLTAIRFMYVPDAAIALARARDGDIDVLPELIDAHYPGQARAPGIAESFRLLPLSRPEFRYLLLHPGRPVFADADTRRAVSLLVDRTAQAGPQSTAIIDPIWPGGPVEGGAAAAGARDGQLAARHLERAGWVDHDNDGLRQRDGGQLLIRVIVEPGEDRRRDRLLDDLRRGGFLVDVAQGTPQELLSLTRAGKFDAALLRYRGAVDSPITSAFAPIGSALPGATRASLDRIAGAASAGDRRRVAAELRRALASEAPAVFLSRPTPHALVHRRVKGLRPGAGFLRLRGVSLAPVGPAE